MALSADLAALDARLSAAIEDIMKTDMANAIKEEVSEHLEEYAYTRSRGKSGGGVRDKRNFNEDVTVSGDTYTLTVTDDAPFQGTPVDYTTLAEVVESGDKAFRMPRPRPFLAPTQQTMDSGEADRILRDGLTKRGFSI